MATKGDISDLNVLFYGGQPMVPLVEGFTRSRQSGVVRSDVAGGASRQRKKYFGTTHIASATFYLRSPAQMDYIQLFINNNEGKRWICHLAADRPLVEPYVVQALTDWNHVEVNALRGTVTVQLEIFSARDECLDETLGVLYPCIGDDICEYLTSFGTMTEGWPLYTPIIVEQGITLDFINRRYYKNQSLVSLGDVMTFTRASAGTDFVGGVLTDFGVDIPRVGDDGLLVEGEKTNVLNFTKNLTNWASSNVSISVSSEPAPKLSDFFTRAVPSLGVSQKTIAKSSTLLSAGEPVTTSVFAKKGELDKFQIRWFGGATGVSSKYANFDLSLGVFSGTASRIEMIKMGVTDTYLCVAGDDITGTMTGGQDTGFEIISSLSDGRRPNFNGDGVSGLYLYGAMSEVGLKSSYIESINTPSTRQPDLTTIDISDTISTDCTVFFEYNWDGRNSNRALFTVSDGSNNHIINCQHTASGNVELILLEFGVVVATVVIPAPATGVVRVGVVYSQNSVSLAVNGQVSSVVPTGVVTSLNQIELGVSQTGAEPLNGHIRRTWYRPRAFTEQELIEVTS